MPVQIEQLWVEVTGTVFPRKGDWAYATPEHIRQFAERVIRECAECVDRATEYDEGNNVYPAEAQDVLDHFGVK